MSTEQLVQGIYTEILIIDDDEFNLMATTEVLGTLNMICETSMDGL